MADNAFTVLWLAKLRAHIDTVKEELANIVDEYPENYRVEIYRETIEFLNDLLEQHTPKEEN
jgi:hypothetical protein